MSKAWTVTSTSCTFDANNNIMTKSVLHPAGYTYDFKLNGVDYEIGEISMHDINYKKHGPQGGIPPPEFILGVLCPLAAYRPAPYWGRPSLFHRPRRPRQRWW